jgi:GT2 family glycosyltransferase
MGAAPLILVVGMHRSGTSLLGSLLDAMGLSSSGPLIPGDEHNPEGYYERADITAIQEELLRQLGRWWPSAEALLPLPPSWLVQPCTDKAHQALLHALAAEPSNVPLAIKDPRSSRLLPLWRRIASELNRPLQLLLAVRDPQEVITSLVNRDGSSTGMDVERAANLWWQHNREALLHSQGLPLLTVDYSRWFDGSAAEQLQAIAGFCDRPIQSAAEQANLLAQIRPEHRRSHGHSQPAPELCTAFYRSLQEGKRNPPEARSPLDPPHQQSLEPRGRLQEHPWGGIALTNCQGNRKLARALLESWQSEGLNAERGGPELLQGWFDADFYSSSYSDLHTSIPSHNATGLLRHYLLHGWREGRQPHACFDPVFYLQQLHQRGIQLPQNRSPLEHFLDVGRSVGIAPTALLDPRWMPGSLEAAPPDLASLHPWAGAALTLADHAESSAAALLQHWIAQGTPPESVIQLAATNTGQNLRWIVSTPATGQQQGRASAISLESWPPSRHGWETWGWLSALDQEHASGSFRLCLSLPDHSTIGHWLRDDPASGIQLLETDPQRHILWQRFGLNSQLLQRPKAAQLDRWLAADPWLNIAENLLGLPHPAALSHQPLLCFGQGGPFWDEQPNLDLAYVPGLNDLAQNTETSGRAVASWLWRCHRLGINLVEFSSTKQEATQHWLPVTKINPFGLDQQGLLDILNQKLKGWDSARILTTPEPAITHAFDRGEPGLAPVAVVVSLYNYGDQILNALESIRQQTLSQIELIVVDDASNDDGPAVVRTWMEKQHQRFSRCLLVNHRSNGGLASARNTGFRLASAPWCFVLDADNHLRPRCLERCWTIAQQATPTLAVVHPLIQRRKTNGSSDGLISGRSWQRASFLQGNQIDAMAMVKRQAWSCVGGYTHIPNGWEDYDFWCKLIEANWHGVLCPEILCTYHIHDDSMAHQRSHRNTLYLSYILQTRHPWLKLPLCSADSNSAEH